MWTAVGLALLGILFWLRSLLPPFVLAFVLAYLLDPVLDFLERQGMSRIRGILWVYGLFFAVFVLILLFIVPALIDQARDLVQYSTNYAYQLQTTLETWLIGWQNWLEQTRLPGTLGQMVRDGLQEWQSQVDAAVVSKWLFERLSALGSWLASGISKVWVLVLLPFTTYYFLRDYDPLRLRLRVLIPAAQRETVLRISRDVSRVLGGYLRGQLLVSFIVLVANTLALEVLHFIFGIKYVLVLGILAGVLSLVPYFGAPVSAAIAAIIAYITSGYSWIAGLVTPATMLVINFLSDTMIAPKVVGEQVGLHPLLLLFALMAGGKLFGAVGMIAAAPVAASIKVVLVHYFPQLTAPLPKGEEPEEVKATTATEETRAEEKTTDEKEAPDRGNNVRDA